MPYRMWRAGARWPRQCSMRCMCARSTSLAFRPARPMPMRWRPVAHSRHAISSSSAEPPPCTMVTLDLQIRCRCWGFDLRGIGAQVFMQHAVDDTSVPFAAARITASLLRHCVFDARQTGDHFSSELLDAFLCQTVLGVSGRSATCWQSTTMTALASQTCQRHAERSAAFCAILLINCRMHGRSPHLPARLARSAAMGTACVIALPPASPS